MPPSPHRRFRRCAEHGSRSTGRLAIVIAALLPVAAGAQEPSSSWPGLAPSGGVSTVYWARFAAGHVVQDGRHLFVATGVGTSIVPVRFRVPPAITMLTLARVSED